MTRVAAIDIGTNSVKLAIADVAGDVSIVREESEITRLGKGVDASRRLDTAAMQRTLDVISRFAGAARDAGAIRITAIGTSALRDAENGSEFTGKLKDLTGLDLEVITGDREAKLALLSVTSDSNLGIDSRAEMGVFDIGGGSTEVNIGSGGGVTFHKSFDIGAVRLTERLIPSDPPARSEIEAATSHVRQIFHEISKPKGALAGVGIGGTVVNVAAVNAGSRDGVHGASLTQDAVRAVLERLASVAIEERKTIPGLEPARADVIVGGAIVLLGLMERLELESVRVSVRGLRYGLLKEIAGG